MGNAGTKLGLSLSGAGALRPGSLERITFGGAAEPAQPRRMFSQLVSSGRSGGRSVSAASWSASTAAHFLVLLMAAAAASRLAAPRTEPADRGEVTYLLIAEPEKPSAESPAEAPPEPPPPPTIETAPEPATVTPPDLLAGFQELLPPREVAGIPDPASVALADPADFRGRGVVGGVAGGRVPLPGEPIGKESAEVASAESALTPEMLYVQPRILNLSEIAPRMEDLYPVQLHAIGLEGQVMIKFVIDTKGHVEPETVSFVESTNPGFEQPTRALLALLRWAPGEQPLGRAVRTWVVMPVGWTIAKKR